MTSVNIPNRRVQVDLVTDRSKDHRELLRTFLVDLSICAELSRIDLCSIRIPSILPELLDEFIGALQLDPRPLLHARASVDGRAEGVRNHLLELPPPLLLARQHEPITYIVLILA